MRAFSPPFILALWMVLAASGCAGSGQDAEPAPPTASPEDADFHGTWPQWGGPQGMFRVDASDLADSWPEGGPPRLWERELGPGYSSMVVENDELFTMYRDKDNDVVIALDATDGSTRWEYRYSGNTYEGNVLDFGTGPNASPLLLDDRVIALGFGGMLHALARDTGEVLWSHDLIIDLGGEVQDFGYSASPILHDGTILVPMGGDHSIVAMDPEDGSIRWQSGPRGISYSTPLVIDVDGREQVVFFSGVEILGIDAGDGHELWSFPVKSQYSNNATNLHWQEGNLLWVAAELDAGTRVLRLTREQETIKVEEVWSSNKMSIHHWNTVVVDGHIYGSFGGQGSILQSIELATGHVLWRERGFPKINSIYADGKLIFLDEKGRLGLARVSPQKIEVLARAQVATEEAWTVPILAGSVLYVRDNKKILALDLGT